MKHLYSPNSCIPLLLLFLFISAPLEAQDKYQSLHQALFSAGRLSGNQGPQNVTWIENGERYSYMQYNSNTRTTEIRAYNPSTGNDELIFNNASHTFPESDNPFEYESFQWSRDFRYLIFQSNFHPVYRYSGTADYYYYSIEDETLELITRGAFTAELSPDGQKVGYHKAGELYVFNLNSREEKQLTFNSENNLFNGRFGWVYEEEFGKVQAWSWSPDSDHIAYWQTNEQKVKRFVSTNYEGKYPEYTDIPYPKVGSENPTVKIGVVSTETADNQWMDIDVGDGLIPRIYWTSIDNQLAVVLTNRQQNNLKLLFHDVNTGSGNLIMEENSEDGWIDVYDFSEGIDDYFFFPDQNEEYYWISDRDGWQHIYRYSYDGEVINQVTRGNWQVTNVHAINSNTGTIYYSSTEKDPLERHLYSVQSDGSDKTKYTSEPGYHSINMGPDGRYYIDSYSNTSTPKQVELHTTGDGGRMLEKLEENEGVSNFIEQNVYSHRELFTFTTSIGVELDGYFIKPSDFDPDESYPLLLMVYGGPGSQDVYNQFETNAWAQFLSQQGYVIANVNNRGSGGYGRDFEESVYLNLGELEAIDFTETAKYLAKKDWVDGDNMAIRGHSYGGYMAALTMVLHPGVFKAALVGAPVTDWRLYDTIYTERYMGLLDENRDNYENGSVMAHAQNLNGEMLVAHSSMDENVHIQNSMQMIRAFTDAGKDVDLRIYPPGAHGVAYNQQSYLLLFSVYTEYLNRHLKN